MRKNRAAVRDLHYVALLLWDISVRECRVRWSVYSPVPSRRAVGLLFETGSMVILSRTIALLLERLRGIPATMSAQRNMELPPLADVRTMKWHGGSPRQDLAFELLCAAFGIDEGRTAVGPRSEDVQMNHRSAQRAFESVLA